MSEFINLDLKEFCNHRFVYSELPEDIKQIGLEGIYIDAKDIRFDEVTVADDVRFRFNFGDNDNIACEGQRIPVNAAADKLHIMAFTNWGDTYEQFRVEYGDGSSEWIKLPFLDWSHKMESDWRMIFNVTGNITSPISVLTSGVESRLVCLHHTTAELKRGKTVTAITLPDNFWLHVFAITLEKED